MVSAAKQEQELMLKIKQAKTKDEIQLVYDNITKIID